jgi:hypothetical protein
VVIPPEDAWATDTGWDQAVEAHLRVLRVVQPPSVLDLLSRRAGFPIGADGGNGAVSYADVLRYLRAVQDSLGRSAWLSAKLLITHRMREMGLAPELPRAGRAATGIGPAPRQGDPSR